MHDQLTTSLPTAVDRQVVADAYGKLLKGEKLSKAEQAALARFEKEKEERLRWQFYRTIPKKHWRRMSGRQDKVLNEQAKRYGLPLDSPTFDLPKFVAAFHDFLAEACQSFWAAAVIQVEWHYLVTKWGRVRSDIQRTVIFKAAGHPL